MITTGALMHGKVARHRDFDPAEEPMALQLGGSEPQALAESARLGRQWGYDEINLNCGCPSERVQRGAFGASLMAEPDLVADRSEEHTSELQSLMRISYAVFCLKKKRNYR